MMVSVAVGFLWILNSKDSLFFRMEISRKLMLFSFSISMVNVSVFEVSLNRSSTVCISVSEEL